MIEPGGKSSFNLGLDCKILQRDKQFNKAMAVSNAKGIDAIFVEISLLNPNHFLACRRAKNTLFIQDFLVILKM